MTTYNTTLYTNEVTNKYLQDRRDRHGPIVPIKFSATMTSPASIGDVYNLCVVPANWRVVGLFCTTNGLATSAGQGTTWQIGDTDDTDRLMAATDFDAVDAQGNLAYAGMGWTPTADTVVYGTFTGLSAGAAATVGQIVSGFIFCIPGA